MNIYRYILASIFILSSHAFDCPGATENGDCSTRCSGIGICYTDLDGKEGKGMCCEELKSFCTATGLSSFHSKSGNGYKHKWNPSMADQYYEDPVTKATCPLPYAYNTPDLKELPVGFSKTSSTPLKSCEKNPDCGPNEYCGLAVNPSYASSINIDKKKFCYRAPNQNNVMVKIDSYEYGLQWCANHKRCMEMEDKTLCLKSIKYRQNSGADGDKMCAKALICPNPDGKTTSEGSLTSNGEFCKTDTDCAEHGKYKSDKFQATCVPVNGDAEQKVCCYEPKKEEPLMCPDGATPLSGEPMCTGSNEEDEYSGKCGFDSNGMCYRGHCCPTAKKVDKKVVIGATTYTTAVKCNNNEMVPSPFVFAKCEKGRVVVLGKDKISQPLDSYKKCTKQSDCSDDCTCVSTDDGGICVPNELENGVKGFVIPISVIAVSVVCNINA